MPTATVPTATLPGAHVPTPVEPIAALSAPGASLWVKRDDLTHHVYGGNKVRKLERLLEDARARGAKRLVTVGAVGSHHVLATAYFGRQAGFPIEAVLVPQPRTEHVVEVLRADLGLGLKAFPVGSWAAVPWAVLARVVAGSTLVPLGGSSAVGTMGYVDAGGELAAQIRRGVLPEPDVCVVALGSGGTAAGLAVGFRRAGLRTRVVGVCVSAPPWALRASARHLARACGRRTGVADARIDTDDRFLGAGYGFRTREGDEATELARTHAGLILEPTYTAKAFACALWFVRARQERTILYWHTLSSAPMRPLLEGAPQESQISAELLALAVPASPGLVRSTSGS
jgi:1-aminocyclopropane-1-carboxylate deaminase/D-cysteine desulfhydrase-like pyridoxal-dependent ACC family enzyme